MFYYAIKIFSQASTIKKYLYIIIILIISALITLFCFYKNTTNSINNKNYTLFHKKTDNHYSKEITINVYNITGHIKCQLITNDMQYFPIHKVTKFKQPKITVFNTKNTAIWKITCNQAKLNYKNQLNLKGYVHIDKITNNICSQSIITQQLIIDFKNQDIISDKKTIIYNNYFYSIGSTMHINIKTQTIQLSNDVYTQYYIQ